MKVNLVPDHSLSPAGVLYRLHPQGFGQNERKVWRSRKSIAGIVFESIQAKSLGLVAPDSQVEPSGSRKLLGCLLGVAQAKVHQPVPQVLNRHSAGANPANPRGTRIPSLPLRNRARVLSSVTYATRFQEIRWSLSAGTCSAGPASTGQQPQQQTVYACKSSPLELPWLVSRWLQVSLPLQVLPLFARLAWTMIR